MMGNTLNAARRGVYCGHERNWTLRTPFSTTKDTKTFRAMTHAEGRPNQREMSNVEMQMPKE